MQGFETHYLRHSGGPFCKIKMRKGKIGTPRTRHGLMPSGFKQKIVFESSDRIRIACAQSLVIVIPILSIE